jgi:hypothetical protein
MQQEPGELQQPLLNNGEEERQRIELLPPDQLNELTQQVAMVVANIQTAFLLTGQQARLNLANILAGVNLNPRLLIPIAMGMLGGVTTGGLMGYFASLQPDTSNDYIARTATAGAVAGGAAGTAVGFCLREAHAALNRYGILGAGNRQSPEPAPEHEAAEALRGAAAEP